MLLHYTNWCMCLCLLFTFRVIVISLAHSHVGTATKLEKMSSAALQTSLVMYVLICHVDPLSVYVSRLEVI